ncbi:unnamed protein product [Lactuca saligna]|uniref:Uncharacterized protein n=1 Tax=Lactuca saligna TaxID=75948 RepID=A0AA36EGS9_LACSI|nr:unnamed protein product [Lactuca saligna]
MAKEVATLHHDYSSFYTTVDIIVDAVTNLVEWYNSFIPKFDTKGESDAQEVAVLKTILNTLTVLVSKVGSSSFELLTPKFLTQKFRLLEFVIHTELAPHETGKLYANGCSPIHTGWKGGGGGWCWHGIERWYGSVVIGSGVGGSSSSKPPPSTENMKMKGKGISTEPIVEEKKVSLGKEIESLVISEEMHDFEKVPNKSYATNNTDFNELDFPINKMMFMAEQYQIFDKFEGKEEYKRMKIQFHAILGKREVDIWSLVKIVRVLNISKDFGSPSSSIKKNSPGHVIESTHQVNEDDWSSNGF